MNKNSKLKIRNSDLGFTLMEAVVATALFAFVVSSVIGVYLSVIQLDRKARSQRIVAQNARFIMDFLAKEVRNGSINYNCSQWNGIVVGTSNLCVQNQANELERFYLSGTNLKLEKNNSSTNMNSSKVLVSDLKFYVSPAEDPYTPAKTYNVHPHVTVVLELTSNYGTAPTAVAKIRIQDTFTPRYYPSRQ